MKLLYSLLVLALLLTSTVRADSITTIQLQHRPAAEVIPVIKPMLGTTDAITGRGFKLFLRASAETLAQVYDIIDALDIAANILQISVFQGSKRALRNLSINGNLQIDGGDTRVDIGTNAKQNNAGISYSTDNVSGDISASDNRAQRESNPIHRLRVSENTAAYIQTGQQIPYFAGVSRTAPAATAGGIVFKDVTTGFYVLPRIHGEQVTLQISPFKNSLRQGSTGNIETQHASTTISGRIGEWLLIGGVTESINRSQSGIASYSSTNGNRKEDIWIKADLVQ